MTKSVHGEPAFRYFALVPDDEEAFPLVAERDRQREVEEKARWKAFWFGKDKARRESTAPPADSSPIKDPDLAKRLRIARKFAGYTGEAAAVALGVTRYTLGNYEHARSSVPALVLWRMTVLYRRPWDWFFRGQERRYDPYKEGAVQVAGPAAGPQGPEGGGTPPGGA